MLRRFAAASATCAVLIAVAALVVLAVRPVPLERASLALLLWCLAPAVWGLWALLAPARWIALPLWGALLGAILSGTALLALNLPQQVFGLPLSLFVRLLGVMLAAAFYYVAWSIVGVVQEALQPRTRAEPNPVSEHLLAAHDLLLSARGASSAHPQVEEAIRQLELALANLTLRTSGML